MSAGWILALGIVAGLVLLLAIGALLERIAYSGLNQKPFWGCRWGLHPWLFRHEQAKVIPPRILPPPGVGRASVQRLCGERHYRYCPACERLQECLPDGRGCYSITDPPSWRWVDLPTPTTPPEDTRQEITP